MMVCVVLDDAHFFIVFFVSFFLFVSFSLFIFEKKLMPIRAGMFVRYVDGLVISIIYKFTIYYIRVVQFFYYCFH